MSNGGLDVNLLKIQTNCRKVNNTVSVTQERVFIYLAKYPSEWRKFHTEVI